MSSHFRTAVRSNVASTERRAAIDRMTARDERTNLGILVRMGGLDAEFRRRALHGLADCNAGSELTTLADDGTVAPSLRRLADELA